MVLGVEDWSSILYILNCHTAVMTSNASQMTYEVASMDAFVELVETSIGRPNMQLIFPNGDVESRVACPYVMVVMEDFGDRIPMNFVLENIFFRMQVAASARCRKALLIGVTDWRGSDVVSMPITVIGAMHLVEASYELVTSCSFCQRSNKRCTFQLPCGRCEHRGDEACLWGNREWFQRPKEVFRLLSSGGIVHSDVGKYQIYLQCQYYGLGRLMMVHDMEDISSRLQYYEGQGAPPHPSLQEMPLECLGFVSGQQYCKLEWCYAGRYYISTTQGYGSEILGAIDILSLTKTVMIPPKLVDTLGLGWVGRACQMWSESILMRGTVVSHEGPIYFKKTGKVVQGKISMLTIVFSFDHLLTVTLVERTEDADV